MKRFLLLSPLLVLAACAPTSPQQNTSAPPAPPAVEHIVPQGRVIQVTAELWKWTPDVVTVKQGEQVTLQVTGVSGTHGFSAPELDIDAMIFEGKTVMIPLPTDTPGTFNFSCSIQCGSGHNDMTGRIVIEEGN